MSDCYSDTFYTYDRSHVIVIVNNEMREVRRRWNDNETQIEVNGQWFTIASHPVQEVMRVLILPE